MDIGTTLRHFKNRFLFGPRLRANGVRCRFAIAGQVAGCDLAAKQAGRNDFFIVSVDGAPEVVPFLRDPTSLITATAAQDPYTMTEEAVTLGYDSMNGKKPASALTLIPVRLITKDNVNSYQGWTK